MTQESEEKIITSHFEERIFWKKNLEKKCTQFFPDSVWFMKNVYVTGDAYNQYHKFEKIKIISGSRLSFYCLSAPAEFTVPAYSTLHLSFFATTQHIRVWFHITYFGASSEQEFQLLINWLQRSVLIDLWGQGKRF